MLAALGKYALGGVHMLPQSWQHGTPIQLTWRMRLAQTLGLSTTSPKAQKQPKFALKASIGVFV